MNKDYPRDCLKVFDVLKNDVIVFTGTAREIADKLYLVDKGYVVQTAKRGRLLCGEWKIRFLDWMIETA